MVGVIVYDDKAKCFQIYCSDDVYHLLQARESLEIKANGNWLQTTVERKGQDDVFGWQFSGLGSCACHVGHSAKIPLSPCNRQNERRIADCPNA